MSKELRLLRRLIKIEQSYRNTVMELGRHIANRNNFLLKDDEAAFNYGLGAYRSIADEWEKNQPIKVVHNADQPIKPPPPPDFEKSPPRIKEYW